MAPPIHDAIANARVVSGTDAFAAETTIDATYTAAESAAFYTSPSVWYRVEWPSNGRYTIAVSNASDSYYAELRGITTDPPADFDETTAGLLTLFGAPSEDLSFTTATKVSGTVYYLWFAASAFDGSFVDSFDIDFTFVAAGPPPANDDFDDAQVVLSGTLEEEGIAGTIVDATEQDDWEVLGGYTDAPGVWYRFETPAEETKLYWKITKTGGDAGFKPGADLYSGPATPTDYDDLVDEPSSLGDGTDTPDADFLVLAASTHYYVLVFNYSNTDQGDFDIDFQLVPSYLREEWEELDTAIWRIGSSDPPTGSHWTISTDEAFSGTTSVKNASDGTTKRLIYEDEVGQNQDDVEYWLAYKFLVPDWEPIWDTGGFVRIPGHLLGVNSTGGLGYWALEANSATDGVIWTLSDGDFLDYPITAGEWHELRISMERTGGNGIFNEILDGVQISTAYNDGVYGSGLRPSGVYWESNNFNLGAVIHLDSLIWSPGADPGEIFPVAGDDEIAVPFLSPTTTVFTPVLEGEGNANLGAPFIAATATVFDAYLSGDQDVLAPFIASETTMFGAFLLSGDPALISQLPVEVVMSPTDADARLSQLPVEVIQRASRESVIVIVID